VRCFYSDTFVLPLPEGHRFPMAKYSGLRERILRDRIVSPDDLSEAPRASWVDLRLVHDQDYLTAVGQGLLPRAAQRRIGFPWSPQMVERARRSVGATIAAARAALDGGAAANLAGGTHHAFPDRGEGYCVFNDVAVAARVLQRDCGVTRVAVVDCDVHQGDGTAAIFRDDRSVFTLSLHGARNYPFRKQTSDLDVELDDGTGDEPYLAKLAHSLDVVFDANPHAVFYLAGADPYEGDRLGRLTLTIEGLRRRDTLVFARCRAARVPVVITMSGGYADDIESIVTIHANTILAATTLLAEPAPGALAPAAPGAPGAPAPAALCPPATPATPVTLVTP
jgi:acetoin utilization deacetylase AcuC-like enzyme